jgi:hypothetical protein
MRAKRPYTDIAFRGKAPENGSYLQILRKSGLSNDPH